ncbi:MEDS domain-containing protein [Actinophytocola xanthii]|uniref:STAS domain-containing protein n=1 Tax=Actinophytocola xanthii TaxID=1912961 RepID=A0A1Q8CUU6_9PSEU|nr:MEDS domain-containing protein [Actinophytocola xanthii]OLF18122.1 hypothetical protein BU204_08285 [Actinophytocola xanthii]
MRMSGVVDDVRRLGRFDHVCWAFDDADTFRAQAVTFLAQGLADGQRVWFVGDPDPRVVDALPAASEGAFEVVTTSSTYSSGVEVDADSQVRTYARSTEQALADGFTGLRVATDATPLVRTRGQLEAFTRYEHQVDRYMAGSPFSAMCGYDRGVLGGDAVAELACMHPNANDDATPFRLHAATLPGCAAAIGGELDILTEDLLVKALRRADLRPDPQGELVLDATALTFLDHNRLLQLVGHAEGLGARLVLRTDQPIPRRLVQLMDLPAVRIEAAR